MGAGKEGHFRNTGITYKFKYNLLKGLYLEPLSFMRLSRILISIYYSSLLETSMLAQSIPDSKYVAYWGESIPHHKSTNWISATDEFHICLRTFVIIPKLLTTEAPDP